MDCIQFYVFTYCTTFLKMHKTFPLNKVLFSAVIVFRDVNIEADKMGVPVFLFGYPYIRQL